MIHRQTSRRTYSSSLAVTIAATQIVLIATTGKIAAMAAIRAEFTLSYEEYAEAYRAQRNRKRFLSVPPERSVWVGWGWLAVLTVVILIFTAVAIYMTGKQGTGPTGQTYLNSDSPVAAF